VFARRTIDGAKSLFAIPDNGSFPVSTQNRSDQQGKNSSIKSAYKHKMMYNLRNLFESKTFYIGL